MEVDGGGAGQQQEQQEWVVPAQEWVEGFYRQTLFEAMQKQTAVPAAAPAQDGAAAAAAAIKQAMVAAAAAGGAGDAQAKAAAVAAAAAAATAAAKATAADGGSSAAAAGGSSGSVAKESENDGRVSGACKVLVNSLDVWRVVFREPLPFEGFVYALMASRCHSSVACLRHLQLMTMQVRRGGG
jgi:hypothetical protein